MFVDGLLVGFSGDAASRPSAHERAQEMFAELSEYSSLRLSEFLVPGEEPPVGPAIVRSARNCYVLRGANQAAVDALQELLKGGLPRPKALGSAETTATRTPHLKMRLVVHQEEMERALAKTALNFLCHAWGPEFARQQRFDGVRQFALKGPADLSSPVRFVEKAPDQDNLSLFCRPDHHAIVLCASDALGVVAQVVLYQRSVATVQLSTTADEVAWIAGVFNYKTGRHRLVAGDEENESFTAQSRGRAGAEAQNLRSACCRPRRLLENRRARSGHQLAKFEVIYRRGPWPKAELPHRLA